MVSFKRAIGSKPLRSDFCLLTTACYGGGWAINPNLNITSSTAQHKSTQSLAWPVSGTRNARACGSPFASAVAKSLLSLTIDGSGRDDYENFDYIPTYSGFIKVVRDKLQQLDQRSITVDPVIGSSVSVHQSMFSAQGDEWEMAYSTRTGFPLRVFRSRWLQLRAASPNQPPPGGEHRFEPRGRVFSYDQLLAVVVREAKVYMGSKPGYDSKAKNVAFHNSLNSLINGSYRPDMLTLAYLRGNIEYRMNQITLAATIYKDFLGIRYRDCHEVDTDKYPRRYTNRWINAYELVRKYPLFDRPESGHEFDKGINYLAACIIESGWSQEEAGAKLDGLVKYKGIISAFSKLP
jgi:hypothetical protein